MCYGFRVHAIQIETEPEKGRKMFRPYVLTVRLGREGRALHDFGTLIYSDDHPLTVAGKLETLAGEIRSRMRGF